VFIEGEFLVGKKKWLVEINATIVDETDEKEKGREGKCLV
jgi:hypothetical protein